MSIDEEKIKSLIKKVVNEFEYNEQGISIEVSARHIHLSKEDLHTLFGNAYQLRKVRDLSQPGQFVAEETVRIIGPKGEFPQVRVLGPVRDETQIEISISDSYVLGIEPVIRMSGDIEETPGCIVYGPMGFVILKKGVIAAKRHFHCCPDTAEKFGIKDGDSIDVEVKTERSAIIKDIVVRVSNESFDAIHLDTDEGNAFAIKSGEKGIIIK